MLRERDLAHLVTAHLPAEVLGLVLSAAVRMTYLVRLVKAQTLSEMCEHHSRATM